MNGEDETRAGPHSGPPPHGPGPHRPAPIRPGAQAPSPQSGRFYDDPYGGEPTRQNWGPADPQYRPPSRGQDPYQQYDPYQGQGGRRILDQEPDLGAFDRDPYEYDGYDDNYQREDFDARRGPGGVLWFVVAAVAVTVLGLGFAAFSVLSDGEDESAVTTTGSTGTAPDTTTTTAEPTTTTASTLPPNALDMQVASPLFVCDGTTQQLGSIQGAEPGEEITFTSPQSSSLLPGQADESGNLAIRWNCTPDQVGTAWELTATGVTSGKTATVTFTGATAEEAAAGAGAGGAGGSTETTADPAALGPLTVETVEDPFSCNGEVRQFAVLSGASPGAEVTFTSPQSDNIRPGTVDESGSLPIRWNCTPDQVGTVWELTATETETGRSVAFTITGQ